MAAPGWAFDLVELAAALAARDGTACDAVFARLRAAGRALEVEECVLQSYLFLGYPAAIEAFRRWRAHAAEPPPATDEDWDFWAQRGEQICATVYSAHYPRLRRNMARFHADLDRWMVVEGYGKVLGRPGLDLTVREMCIVGMLVVQGESGRRQLRSHLKGALNAGVAPEDVEKTIRRAAAFAPAENLELAQTLWSAVLDSG